MLLTYEGEGEGDLSKWTVEQINYHKRIMQDAGLIITSSEAKMYSMGFKSDSPKVSVVIHDPPLITWAGHEFIDKARDETVWNKVKSQAGGALTSLGVPILVELLQHTIREKLGMS